MFFPYNDWHCQEESFIFYNISFGPFLQFQLASKVNISKYKLLMHSQFFICFNRDRNEKEVTCSCKMGSKRRRSGPCFLKS